MLRLCQIDKFYCICFVFCRKRYCNPFQPQGSPTIDAFLPFCNCVIVNAVLFKMSDCGIARESTLCPIHVNCTFTLKLQSGMYMQCSLFGMGNLLTFCNAAIPFETFAAFVVARHDGWLRTWVSISTNSMVEAT